MPKRLSPDACQTGRIGRLGGISSGTISTDSGTDNGAPVGSTAELWRYE